MIVIVLAALCLNGFCCQGDREDPRLAIEPVHLGDLEFYYPTEQLLSEEVGGRWHTLIDHDVARFQARPSKRIATAIEWATESSWDFAFQSMTIHRLGEDSYFWSTESFLMPTHGGMTGVPPSFRTVVSAKGDLVEPHIAYRSTCRVENSLWVRCRLAHTERDESSSPVLYGDAIKVKAEAHVAEFQNKLNKGRESDSERTWLYHSQELVDGYDGTSRVWKVYFVYSSDLGSEHTPNTAPRFCLYGTERGRFGTLSLVGTESVYHWPTTGEIW